MDIFFDSNYYIGLVNRQDSIYLKSLNLSHKLKDISYKPFISNLIFIEVVTVISQRVGREAAVTTGEYLKSTSEIVRINYDLEQKTWELFKQVKQKDVSFVDCSTLVFLKDKKIEKLVTFDKHFTKLSYQFNFSIFS